MCRPLIPILLFVLLMPLASCDRQRERSMAETYQEAATRIIEEALASEEAYRKLAHLSNQIGHRLSGSAQLDRAIEWAAAEMGEDGLENVHTEEVMVPVWVRGEESAKLLRPIRRELPMLGLGLSVGTPPRGITADVVVVKSFDELDEIGREGVEGKIVLYAVEYERYGKTVKYRGEGASRAAKHGAVASLIRSISPKKHNMPHTGMMTYDEDLPKIPAAALTVEDAELLQGVADILLEYLAPP